MNCMMYNNYAAARALHAKLLALLITVTDLDGTSQVKLIADLIYMSNTM